MRRKSTLKKEYYTRTAENNTARNRAKNTPRIKYTFKVSRADELYYIRRRKAYKQSPYHKHYRHYTLSHSRMTGGRWSSGKGRRPYSLA
jgi:hypothetical protein